MGQSVSGTDNKQTRHFSGSVEKNERGTSTVIKSPARGPYLSNFFSLIFASKDINQPAASNISGIIWLKRSYGIGPSNLGIVPFFCRRRAADMMRNSQKLHI